jgi:hypothetical protein
VGHSACQDPDMVERLVIRAGGYVVCGVAVALVGASVSVLVLTHRDPGDPAWVGWATIVVSLSSLWVVVRAPFVGLVVYPHLVVHRTWSVSRTYGREHIVGASAVAYEGVLGGRGGRLPLLSMAELQLGDGTRVQVPEVSGSRSAVVERLKVLDSSAAA